MRKSSILVLVAVACAAAGFGLSGCKDQITAAASAYYPDSVEFHTSIRTDSAFMRFFSVARPTIPVLDTAYNITYASPMMIIGRSVQGSENIESWGVLRFDSVLTADTLSRVVGIRLLLRDIPFKYGDTSSNHLDLAVYEAPPGNGISYATTSIPASMLRPAPIGSVQLDGFTDSTDRQVAISIDTAIRPDLLATSFAFVVAPGSTMTNCRGFGTSENTADATSIPILEYTVRVDTGLRVITRKPTLDMHVVSDKSITPPHEFTLRGSAGLCELIRFDSLGSARDTAKLNGFSTINNATLALKLDVANSLHSNLAVDTSAGPIVAALTSSNDTGALDWVEGYRDASDPTIINFQLRTLFERWLRNPTLNFGLELRAGYVSRVFATKSIGVEDNTINRWTFFGQDHPDVTKRPKLILSYSKLRD